MIEGVAPPNPGQLAQLREFLDGHAEAAAELARQTSARDLIVDRVDRRLSFVRGKWLNEPHTLPATVVGGLFDGSLAPRGPWGFERLWLATRTDRDADLLGRVRQLGTTLDERIFGRYHLLRQKLPRPKLGLAKLLGEAQLSVDRGQGQQAVREHSRGRYRGPEYVEVYQKRCLIGGGRWPLVYVHPLSDGEVVLQWPSIALEDRLLVIGGIEDPVVRWGRAPVTVRVHIGGEQVGRLELVNRPGLSWTVADTRRHRRQDAPITFYVATEDAAQRWTCLDARVLTLDAGESAAPAK